MENENLKIVCDPCYCIYDNDLYNEYNNEYNLVENAESIKTIFSKLKDLKYEYVKLSDLKEAQIYDVIMFNIEENKSRSVILDNKYRLALPDSYIEALPIENIFFYNSNPQMKYKLFYIRSNIYWFDSDNEKEFEQLIHAYKKEQQMIYEHKFKHHHQYNVKK